MSGFSVGDVVRVKSWAHSFRSGGSVEDYVGATSVGGTFAIAEVAKSGAFVYDGLDWAYRVCDVEPVTRSVSPELWERTCTAIRLANLVASSVDEPDAWLAAYNAALSVLWRRDEVAE